MTPLPKEKCGGGRAKQRKVLEHDISSSSACFIVKKNENRH